jgi:hypothetical protein
MRRRGVRGIAVLAIGAAGWSSGAASQECPASVPRVPAGWAVTAPQAADLGMLTLVLSFHCSDCTPALTARVSTAPATASTRAGSSGSAWAEHGAGSPTIRAGMLDGMLADMRRRTPQCTAQGEVDGVTTVGAASFITIGTWNRCAPAGNELGELTFAGFDGRCLNAVAIGWKGSPRLTSEARSRVHELLTSLRFGE